MTPRIGIDAHYLGQRAGGNETHVRTLLQGLAAIDSTLDFRVYLHPDAAPDTPDAAGFRTAPIPFRSSYLRVPFALPWLGKRDKLDLMHVQYTAPPIMPTPYVVTMHDAVAFRFPESLPFADRHRLRMMTRNTLRRSRRVFTVTEAMRREISTRFHIDPTRITVTPNALTPGMAPVLDDTRREAVRARYGLPDRFILYVGQLQPRKNLGRLVQAYTHLAKEGLPQDLVITGKAAWLYDATFEAVRHSDLEHRIHFTDYVPQADLPVLYSLAEVFAFVSLYEGFGIPVIEALACGTPVIASTDPALVEVAGGGAMHVDPLDVSALAAGLGRLCGDEELRSALVKQGQPHARTYTPEAMARAAVAGYEDALS